MAHHELGLGAYGSDEEEDVAMEHQQEAAQRQGSAEEQGGLGLAMPLDSYASAEPVDNDSQPLDTAIQEVVALQGVNAAPSPLNDSVHGYVRAGSEQPQTSEREDVSEVSQQGRQTPSHISGGQGHTGADQSPQHRKGLDALPPELRQPPNQPCSEKAANFVRNIIKTSRTKNIDFISSLKNHRDYSNPDLLLQLVGSSKLQQYGTAFDSEVFDVDGFKEEDYIDRLLAALEAEQQRRRDIRSEATAAGQVPSIPFQRGAGPLGTLPASGSAGNLQGAAAAAAAAAAALAQGRAQAVASSLLQSAGLRSQAAKAAEAMAARAKRSKWDAPR